MSRLQKVIPALSVSSLRHPVSLSWFSKSPTTVHPSLSLTLSISCFLLSSCAPFSAELSDRSMCVRVCVWVWVCLRARGCVRVNETDKTTRSFGYSKSDLTNKWNMHAQQFSKFSQDWPFAKLLKESTLLDWQLLYCTLCMLCYS